MDIEFFLIRFKLNLIDIGFFLNWVKVSLIDMELFLNWATTIADYYFCALYLLKYIADSISFLLQKRKLPERKENN